MKIEEIVEEFLDRHRQGDSPSIDDYLARFPDLAEELRATLPALALFEEHKEEAEPEGEQITREEIGDYRVIREIGRGGMGIVYEAKHKTLGRYVALKLLTSKLTGDAKARKRFQREAKAAARLHHSNIVPVFEIGEEEGHFFYAMQRIEGSALDEVIYSLQSIRSKTNGERLIGLTNGRLRSHELASAMLSDRFEPRQVTDSSSGFSGAQSDAESAITLADGQPASSAFSRDRSNERGYHRCVGWLGLQVAEALSHAHQRGIIHRDIKPSNLILDGSGVVWVSDFGLAKAEDDGLTQTGEFIGTVRYMSPERFRGTCTESADIYGLGLTLYELLTLKPAFESFDRVELMNLITTTEPRPLQSVDRFIPKDLASIVSKAIDKDPARRYRTASEMAEDLRNFVAGRPIKARPISFVERLIRWSKRNRAQAALYLTIAATTAMVAIVSPLALIREANLRSEAENARTIADMRATSINRNLYFAEMNLAGQAIAEPGGIGRVRELLSHWVPESKAADDLRGWEWHFLFGLSHREELAIHGPKASIWATDFSPDGTEIVAVANDRSLTIWDSVTGLELRKAEVPACSDVDWSPDGSTIASTNFGGRLQIRDAQTLELLHDVSGKPNKRSHRRPVHYSPDGKRIAWSDHQGKLVVWDVEQEQVTLERQVNNLVVCLNWSPDSNRVVCGSGGWIGMLDTTNGDLIWKADLVGDQLQTVCWNSDATRVAAAGHNGRIYVFDADSGKQLESWSGNGTAIWKLSWGPENDQLASAHADRTIRLWNVDNGRPIQELHGHTNRPFSVQWDNTGEKLVSCGNDLTVRVWKYDSANRSAMLRSDSNLVRSIDWHPDGKQLVSGNNTGQVVTWDLSKVGRNRVLQRPTSKPYGTSDIYALDWSPDGQRIAWNNQRSIFVWHENQIFEFEAHDKRIYTIDWHPDSKQLATCSADGFLHVWDGTTGEQLKSFQGARLFDVAWSPDGKLLAAADNNVVKVHDFSSGEVLQRFKSDRRASSICWSPDGSQLAVASRDLKIKIWNVKTGRQIGESLQTTGPIGSLHWSPDLQHPRLAGGSGNGTVRIWDLESRKLALSMDIGGSMSVRWSPDGKRLAASGGDTVYVWDATTSYAKSSQ